MHDLRVDREYVYVPSAAGGYVDEFIGQFDRYGAPWWILQDANFNVLAMADEDGDVVRQMMYDPYGEPLFAEDFAAHPGLKIGHEGLFFDRLEPPAAVSGSISIGGAPQLEPGVFGLYQTGNRVLLSRFGRWAQRDPNVSGQLVRGLWHEGMSAMPGLMVGELAVLVGDGHNLFAFVGGDPSNVTDPSGLFSFASALMTGADMFDTMTGVLDNAEMGLREGLTFATGVLDYNDALFDAIDWALDPNADWTEYAAGPTGMPSSFDRESGPALAYAIKAPKDPQPGDRWAEWNPRSHKGRKHGGPEHQDALEKIANKADQEFGGESVKFNQSLENPSTGVRITASDGRSFRPDLQIRHPNGTLLIIEIYSSQPLHKAKAMLKKMKALLADDGFKKVRTIHLHPNAVDDWIAKNIR